ncbi:hypothetical protein [Clostridium magnum]|uniref:Uncharacterized protein n=1 Tax=Clostridium magnum DSM 2767 TaxID=1121326 RepID=A0A161WD48_9CLOT|nr:hypothetical protein [Clostridium magnum]KZL89635.1 hypothetical protein CLMAG_51350 [Clostridium magnum DSM 2767]SHH74867.1 hypothetical protein SAMN02745944_01318 [Clostridium magnum DSM 2767]
MFNEKKTLNLYTSTESYNNSQPDIVIEDITIETQREGFLVIKDSNNYTHIINVNKFVAVVY